MVANHLKVGGEDVGEGVEVGKDGFASNWRGRSWEGRKSRHLEVRSLKTVG